MVLVFKSSLNGSSSSSGQRIGRFCHTGLCHIYHPNAMPLSWHSEVLGCPVFSWVCGLGQPCQPVPGSLAPGDVPTQLGAAPATPLWHQVFCLPGAWRRSASSCRQSEKVRIAACCALGLFPNFFKAFLVWKSLFVHQRIGTPRKLLIWEGRKKGRHESPLHDISVDQQDPSQGSTCKFKVRHSVLGHGRSGMNLEERPSTAVNSLGCIIAGLIAVGRQHRGGDTKAWRWKLLLPAGLKATG